MEYEVDDLIDDRFKVTGLCNDSGGMGQLLFVKDSTGELEDKLVLKYCRIEEDEYIKRFRREVKLLKSFEGNSKVADILWSNIDYEKPYFVMKFYPKGDLLGIIDELDGNPEKQEKIFYLMVDCISELHSINVFHRDIKPQNFLINGDSIVVSDFGLGMEPNSATRFTSSSISWGTQGYLPPEFQNGGFKHADERGDIYMLGKSFYVLLTNQNPMYLMVAEINPVLFHVIERSCDLDINKRYQSLPELKQALKMAYDVLLNRGGNLSTVSQLISTINDRLKNENKYNSSQIIEFIEGLSLVENSDQIKICLELKKQFFGVIINKKIVPYLEDFLKIYHTMIESEQYGWSFAENIAINMKKIFVDVSVPDKTRSFALEIAIDASQRMRRFAAMDTCVSMITSINDPALAIYVVTVMQKHSYNFIKEIEPSQCKTEGIRDAIDNLNHT